MSKGEKLWWHYQPCHQSVLGLHSLFGFWWVTQSSHIQQVYQSIFWHSCQRGCIYSYSYTFHSNAPCQHQHRWRCARFSVGSPIFQKNIKTTIQHIFSSSKRGGWATITNNAFLPYVIFSTYPPGFDPSDTTPLPYYQFSQVQPIWISTNVSVSDNLTLDRWCSAWEKLWKYYEDGCWLLF